MVRGKKIIRELFESEEISGGRALLVVPPSLPRTSGRTRSGRRALQRELRVRRSLIAEARRGDIVLSGGIARVQRDIRRIRAAIRNRTRP